MSDMVPLLALFALFFLPVIYACLPEDPDWVGGGLCLLALAVLVAVAMVWSRVGPWVIVIPALLVGMAVLGLLSWQESREHKRRQVMRR